MNDSISWRAHFRTHLTKTKSGKLLWAFQPGVELSQPRLGGGPLALNVG